MRSTFNKKIWLVPDKCSLQMNREYFQTVNQNLNRSVEMGVKHVFSSINAHISVLSLGTVICAISDTC